MRTKAHRGQVAESAITLLRTGISKVNKHLILGAYEIVEADDFSWDDLDALYLEWEDLVDEANDILFE
ncbi:hypothetical protein [Fulvivirga imtechensis]|nr:hypothetical protein [Fulvivirga imtechensis]